MSDFNGLGLGLGNLSRLSSAVSRSISAENPTGAPAGGAREAPDAESAVAHLGPGWKSRPAATFKPGETITIAEIDGPGAIQSIWMTTRPGRSLILRIYWDDEPNPSVECPVPDFFAVPWFYGNRPPSTPASPFAQIASLPVAVNPRHGFNCYWEMPFRRKCRITVENRHPKADSILFYQVNYALTEVPEDSAYFHACFRRENPSELGKPYTILDCATGQGHYVGVSMGWGINHNGWWGEGEIKFYIDGDTDYPTICGTGVEDYFGGAWDWDVERTYTPYTTPFLGMPMVIRPDGLYSAQLRHALYRWHVLDPVRYTHDLRVTIGALGHSEPWIFQPGSHDICSTAFWYQTLPAAKLPELPSRDDLFVL